MERPRTERAPVRREQFDVHITCPFGALVFALRRRSATNQHPTFTSSLLLLIPPHLASIALVRFTAGLFFGRISRIEIAKRRLRFDWTKRSQNREACGANASAITIATPPHLMLGGQHFDGTPALQCCGGGNFPIDTCADPSGSGCAKTRPD